MKLKQGAKKEFELNGKRYQYFSLRTLNEEGFTIQRLPFSIRVLLESVLRQCDNHSITEEHINNLAGWEKYQGTEAEVPFKPARVILQDFTGVPAVLDLASMRAAMAEAKELQNLPKERKSAALKLINPDVPVDLVIDHSVQVDYYGMSSSLAENMKLEFERNNERYRFLNWAQKAFDNFTVVPPATGIVHQVNLEYLAQVVIKKEEEDGIVVYPDTLVGTDSHTTMINGLGVLGWGVGGIEAETGMLGQPSYFTVPKVIGVRFTNELPIGATATDLALRVTKELRSMGVVGTFVEFFGDGVRRLSLADRATIANMAPEYGATCGFFPVDTETLQYLMLTGRTEEQVALVEKYLTVNDMFYLEGIEEAIYSEVLEIDLSTVETALSGPKRPQDLIALKDMKQAFINSVTAPQGNQGHGLTIEEFDKVVEVELSDKRKSEMSCGAVAVAAITSCTNTSNPSVMLGAGILARKAVEKGLRVPAHVKTSLAPGSKVVTGYLKEAGLQDYLDELGFHIVGYGCTTCIGNSGPLLPEITKAVVDHQLLITSVLSGNRNFEGRIHPLVKANYLASPPLVVAYALAGTVNIDFDQEPIGLDQQGNGVYLKDIWPTKEEIKEAIYKSVKPELFQKEYEVVYDSNEVWNNLQSNESLLYPFDPESTYIRRPPFFSTIVNKDNKTEPLRKLRVLAKFGDSVTTDHISPAGAIGKNTPAGKYLTNHDIPIQNFNTYGSRRGNHEVMMRGTFANIRIRNQIAPETEGGFTTYWPTKEVIPIYDACMRYKETETDLIVLAGKDYGMGSSRDWAAKGPALLGVKAVLAESYERIHRSNLVMMGILPLQYLEGETADSLGLTGEECFEICLLDELKPKDKITVIAGREDGTTISFHAVLRFDSQVEIEYYHNRGILPLVLRKKLMQLEADK